MLLHARSVLIILISTTSLAKGEVFTARQTDDLVNFVDSLMQCRGIVGLTLAVVKGNETWTRGFGMADREGGRPVSTSDVFGIGSLTKAFTSALISLIMDDTGRYSWNTPVVDILGKDFKFATDELTQQVTLKDMLVHRTGLENTDIPLFAGSKLTPAEYARGIRFLPVKKPFRDEFDYNNWMYGLAGYVTEVLGGGPWEELLHSRLLHPLNMTNTAVLGRTMSLQADNLAKPYVMFANQAVLSDPAVYDIAPKEAAGAITSSADDMTKWMQLLLNKGRTQHGHQLLKEGHLQEMTSPYITIQASIRARWNLKKPEFPVMYNTDGYGLGWFTATYRGYSILWHSGGLYAYTTYIALIPSIHLGVFVSNNGPNGKNASHIIRQLFFHIADLVLGKEPWLNTTNACHYPDLWRKPSPAKPAPNFTVYDDHDFDNLDHYVGHYKHPIYEDVDVTRNGSNGLYVRYGFLEGQLCRTEAQNVAVFEVVGSMAFIYQSGSTPTFLQLNFTRPSENGAYREVALSTISATSAVLVFQRVTPPASSGCCGDHGFRVAISVLVVASLSFCSPRTKSV